MKREGMEQRSSNRAAGWNQAFRCLLALALLAVLARTLVFHRRLIEFPYPLDLSEPAQGLLAQGVAAGFSTGDLANFPELSNHYGPFYSLVTGTLCRFGFACGLPGQRFFSALCIALILALLAGL